MRLHRQGNGRRQVGVIVLALSVGCQSEDAGEPARASASAVTRAPSASAPAASAPSASAPPAASVADPPQPSCPERMVKVAGGSFLRGSDRGPASGTLDERPASQVEVSSFCLDATEVTVEAYAACVDAGACTKPKENDPPYAWPEQFNWGKADRMKHPVNAVAFTQAEAFCKFAGKRLPTETEWEFAARGPQGRAHPWGADAPSAKLLNVCDTTCRADGHEHKLAWVAMFEESDGFAYTAPVGSFAAGATPEGILDLEGNVSEWTDGAPCPYDKPDCGAKGHVLRGSSWLDQFKGEVSSSARRGRASSEGYATSGFRCAK